MKIIRADRNDHDAALARVEDGLTAFIKDAVPGENFRPIVLELLESNKRHGGLVAYASWDWLVLDSLNIAGDLRGKGWGRKLLLEAQFIGLGMGCTRAKLETFTAEDWSSRQGFKTVARLPNYPPSRSMAVMTKTL